MNDEWEELFALAEGKSSTAADVDRKREEDGGSGCRRPAARGGSSSDSDSVDASSGRGRKRNRREDRPDGASRAASAVVFDYWRARCDSFPSNNNDHRLAGSFASGSCEPRLACAQWQQKGPPRRTTATATTTSVSSFLPSLRCQRCQRPRGAHIWRCQEPAASALAAAPPATTRAAAEGHHNSGGGGLLTVYGAIRNIRCWCRGQLSASKLLCSSNDSDNMRSGAADATAATPTQHDACLPIDILTEHVRTLRAWCQHHHHNAQKERRHVGDDYDSDLALLQPVLDACLALLQHDVTRSGDAGASGYIRFDRLVRTVMACDAVYYQIYYAQLLLVTPSSDRDTLVPHPVTYFGEWQVDADSEGSRVDDNALVTLHRLRRAETVALFGQWMTRFPEAARQAHELLSIPASAAATHPPGDALHERHATVAPPLLAAWRNSCRDFLCHLYSYATVSNDTLRALHAALGGPSGSVTIVEVGAGTGYLAHLLRTAVVSRDDWSVSAYDAAPDASNEYHAATPPFGTVRPANVASKKFWKQQQQKPPSASGRTVLLLCYPPPDSPMAYQAVRNFCELSNGRRLIHIGEYKGLTGNGDFERYLRRHFVAGPRRWPCESWGTDAATVTIWERRSLDGSGIAPVKGSVLLPCSQCRCVREAVRRCRWLRTLHYCGRACFAADAVARRRALADAGLGDASTTTTTTIELDFDNDMHFVPLPL